MSVTKNEWSNLFFGKQSSTRLFPGIVKDGGIVLGGDGEPAQASVLAHVGSLNDNERVLCALTTSGALYVLGKVVEDGN